MISAFKKMFSIPQLKEKLIFTIVLLVICRVGAYITVPGVNAEEVVRLFKFSSGGGQNLFQLVDIFSGGAFAQMTVIALGVMPYITASILMQIMVTLIPSLQREIRENHEAGKRKIGKATRFVTLMLAVVQSSVYALYAVKINNSNPGIIVQELLNFQIAGYPWLFVLLVVLTMTTGTLLLMWIGEMITERGIGNGVSLIITLGILSSFPTVLGNIIRQLNLDSQESGQLTFVSVAVLAIFFVAILIGTILLVQGQRNIPVQYARRMVGRQEVQGGSANIPLKLNYAGVVPVIFASTFLMSLAFVAQLIGKEGFFDWIAGILTPGSIPYLILYSLLIIFFTYFWTTTQFHPEQIASELKKNGAFIPGVRQGKPTQEYLEQSMNKIVMAGAFSLALIAVLPTLVSKFLSVDANISNFFGGTSLLILVGVVLDTMKQIESHLIMKRYDGFMSKGKY
ncbi:MAG: preprotein translocase subunit SecY [Chlamydiae bacterium]|nr:preprotein translocase subunit SecY [Chlamydiota bacterium]